MLQDLTKSLRVALRSLAKSPTVTTVAILALALGIGANSAIFTVLHAVLLEPLPYAEPERIVRLVDSNPARGFPRFATSPPDFRDWKEASESFEEMAAINLANLTLTGERDPERLSAVQATTGYFETFGVEPRLGRLITAEDDRPGAPKVAVLSEGLWGRRFGADPDVVGSLVELDGEPHEIVGVAELGWPSETDLWVPLALEITEEQRGGHWLATVGRLAPGVSLEAAQAEMSAIARRLEREHPETNTGWGVDLYPLRELMVEDVRPALAVLAVTVALVLLIACANVANVLVARNSTREREVAIKSALGASRGRLLGQFVTESVLLALAGGGLGLLVAFWGTRLLVATNADALPRAAEIGIDPTVVGFTLVLALVTGLAVGLYPALQASRTELGGALRDAGRGGTEGRGKRLARDGLVLVEVALAVVLLVGAGLLLRSFAALQEVSPGFEPEGALAVSFSLPEAKYPEDPDLVAFYDRLGESVRALPGVEAAGAVFPMPLTGSNFILQFSIEGRPPAAPEEAVSTNVRFVTPGYLEAMRIPLASGRPLTGADREGAPEVALVNRAFAERMFPGGESPVGSRFTFGDPTDPEASWQEIVGVVGNVRHRELGTEPEMEAYLPMAQATFDAATLVLRTGGDPMALAGPVRDAVRRIDPDLPLFEVAPVERVVAESLRSQRFNSSLLGLFAGLALFLAAIGVYGVVAYAAARRTREMGLRMALGAPRGTVLALVVRQGMLPVLAGALLGLAAAPLLTRLLESLLYGVEPTDPLALLAAPAILAAVAFVASLFPAVQATRADPLEALRAE